jgi:hypothetical protein
LAFARGGDCAVCDRPDISSPRLPD